MGKDKQGHPEGRGKEVTVVADQDQQEAILKFMMAYREEKKAREEMQLKAMQQMHREKMTIFAGLLEIMKK